MPRAPDATSSGHVGDHCTPGGSRGSGPSSRLTVRPARPSSAPSGAAWLGGASAGRSIALLPRRFWGSSGVTWRSAAPLGGAPSGTS